MSGKGAAHSQNFEEVITMLVPYSRKNNVSVFNPFHDFDELERAFFSDRSLGEFKTDIRDNGDSFTLEADLPGFNKDDIHVDLTDDALTITAAASVRMALTAEALIPPASTRRISRLPTPTACCA